jgi:hypothetical protein
MREFAAIARAAAAIALHELAQRNSRQALEMLLQVGACVEKVHSVGPIECVNSWTQHH